MSDAVFQEKRPSRSGDGLPRYGRRDQTYLGSSHGILICLPHQVWLYDLAENSCSAQCRGMMTFTGLASVLSEPPPPFTGRT